MRNALIATTVAFLCVITAVQCSAPPKGEPPPRNVNPENSLPAEMLGAWQNESNDTVLLFEPRYCTFSTGKMILRGKILRCEPGRITMRVFGGTIGSKASVKEGKLIFEMDSKVESYKRLAAAPPELRLTPFKFGETRDVPADKLKDIKAEFAKREKEDQAVRINPARQGDMLKVDADNTAYVKRISGEFGWIDRERFGPKAAFSAFLIVQHSMNLPLMRAALPYVEAEAKARKVDGQDFALLYDRLQIMLGEKQRYGTQLGQNEKNEPVVFPIEDRANVEQLRKEIGLFPLSAYLEMIKKQCRCETVKFADDEESGGNGK
jgi:hypothetical protein